VQAALANMDGVKDLKVTLGNVKYSGDAKAADVIAAIQDKTTFTGAVE